MGPCFRSRLSWCDSGPSWYRQFLWCDSASLVHLPRTCFPVLNRRFLIRLFFLNSLELAFALGGGIPVDHDGSVVAAAPVVTGNVVNPLLVPAVIPAGTPYESYLFHFDPADSAIPTAANFYPLSSVTFSNKILGVQLFSSASTHCRNRLLTPYVGKLEVG